jgi:iron complex outermembrane recepter protein
MNKLRTYGWRLGSAYSAANSLGNSHGRFWRRFCLTMGALGAAFLFAVTPAIAQQAGTGTVEGRVQSAVTGESLENARVSVKGGTQIVFTDESGIYRLTNVPAGQVTLRVFFTGMQEKESVVTVTPGQVSPQDWSLQGRGTPEPAEGQTVKLDTFTVQSTRETNAQAIAVNEQRFKSNMASVVSTDEFGTLIDRNPGEVLKYLPGIDVESFANNIVGVSVRGLGSENTELNFDGMPVASMNAEAVNRGFEVQYSSSADIARVEVSYVPLPSDSANSMGGSINMIRRSAFEYSKRKIDYRLVFRSDGERFTLKDMDGPKDRLVPRWRPNWEIQWVEPLKKNTLGFTFTVGSTDTDVNTHWSVPGWDLGSSTNNDAAQKAIAQGQDYNHPSLYTPGLRNPLNHNAPLWQGNKYASARVDWRPVREFKFGASVARTQGWKQVADDIRYQWDNSATGSGDRERYVDRYTSLGRLGGGAAFHSTPLWRDIDSPGLTGTIEGQWRKNAWTISGKGTWSISKYNYADTEHGFFNSTTVPNVTGTTNVPQTGIGSGTANPVSLTLNYYDIDYWGPKRIEAFTTPTGLAPSGAAASDPNSWNVPIDWASNSNVRIGGARSRPGRSEEIITAAKTFVKRDFFFTNPLSLQLGFDYTERYRNRHYDYLTWQFVGADGLPNTADDSATLISAVNVLPRRDSQYDYPAIQRISMSRLYQQYLDHPTWFQFDPAKSARLSLTNDRAYDLTEKIKAPYLQFSSHWFHNRLDMTGGVRMEKTDALSHSLLHNADVLYQHYSNGLTIRSGDIVDSATGLPYRNSSGLFFAPTGQPSVAGNKVKIPNAPGAGSLAETALTYKAKGATGVGGSKKYHPSLHINYKITENLEFQVAWAQTQSRLDFQNSIIPSNDVSDSPVTSGIGQGAIGTVNIHNPNLKPQSVNNYDARITYFTQANGLIGLSWAHKDIKNFQTTFATEPITNETLPLYQAIFPDADLTEEFIGYNISSRENTGGAHFDSSVLEMKQGLDRVMPSWGKGLFVRGSVTFARRTGANKGNLGSDRRWRATVATSYRSRKISATVGYNMNGELIENSGITSNGIAGQQITNRQHIVDFNISYRLTRYANLFMDAKNVFNELRASEQRYPGKPDYALLRSSNTFGKTFSMGIQGNF